MVYSSSPTTIREKSKDSFAMRFQERDGEILQTIHAYDGVLARRHLKLMFWPDKSWRAMDRRLSKLYHNRYIDRPNQLQGRTKPIPEPIVWLGWKGAMFVAGSSSVDIKPPTRANENQMRLLQRRLRDQGFHWLREPRWSQLVHDLTVVDFRLAVERYVDKIPHLELKVWQNESVFRSNPDVIQFKAYGRNGAMKTRKKGVIPDGYFEIVDEKRRAKKQPHKARFLLELDMATHDNPSFGIEKAAPGVVYIGSSLYKARFGANAGRWLVATTGEVRMRNLMLQTKEKTGSDANYFFFTTFESLGAKNILTEPIWWQVSKSDPIPLLDE